MSDDLARFPTPQEAFGPRRTSGNASPHNSSVQSAQQPPRMRPYSPQNHAATYPPPNQPRKSSNPAQLPQSYRKPPVNRTASPASIASTTNGIASNGIASNGIASNGIASTTTTTTTANGIASNGIASNMGPQTNYNNYDLEARTANLRLNPASNPPADYYSKFSVPRRPINPETGRSSPVASEPPASRHEPAVNKPRAAADLRSLFDEVDRHKRGYLTERELSKALVNGDYTLFDAHTVRLMMKMFDRDGDGAIYFAEFGQLWRYLHDWRQVFERFDTSEDDSISLDEFIRALAAFGYNLSSTCLLFLFNAGSKLNRQGQREMSFDMFVQSCISIKSITDTFKKYDTDRDGYVTMGFEDFLMETTKLH